jgi:hypothetical protein
MSDQTFDVDPAKRRPRKDHVNSGRPNGMKRCTKAERADAVRTLSRMLKPYVPPVSVVCFAVQEWGIGSTLRQLGGSVQHPAAAPTSLPSQPGRRHPRPLWLQLNPEVAPPQLPGGPRVVAEPHSGSRTSPPGGHMRSMT